MTRTRRIIKTIRGTSKRVPFGPVSFQEDGPTNKMFKAVEGKMQEASSTEVLQHVLASAEEVVNLSKMTWDLFLSELKEGKLYEIVAPVPKENLVDCCSFSTMDHSVLESDKTNHSGAQGWEALKSSLYYEILWKHRGVFPTEVPNRLPADRVSGTRLTWNLTPSIVLPGSSHCRRNRSTTSTSSSTRHPRRDMYVRANRLTAA